jgi:hypothetical protein
VEARMKRRLAAMAALLVVLGSTSAYANTIFDFSITNSTTGTASGQFITTDVVNGQYTVLDVTGFVNGAAITGALGPGSYGSNDNQVFDAPNAPVDSAGVAFSAGGLSYNIFAQTLNPLVFGFCVSTAQSNCNNSQADNAPTAVFTLTSASAVPGPIVGAGLPGLLAAFGAMLAWRRRKAVTA